MGGQTAKRQVRLQFAKGPKKFTHIQSTINLCRLGVCDQTVKNLCWLACKFELDQSQYKPTKSSQVGASPHKWVAKRNASWAHVEDLHWLVSLYEKCKKDKIRDISICTVPCQSSFCTELYASFILSVCFFFLSFFPGILDLGLAHSNK